MKKRSMKSAVVKLIIFLVIGIGLISYSAKGAFVYFRGPKDITNASIDTIKNTEYAKITLDKNNLYGCFSEEYEKSNNTSKKKAYFYLVVVGEGNDIRFMAVKVRTKYYDTLKKIEKEYTALDNGKDTGTTTTLVVKGRIKEMDAVPYKHFKNTIMETYDFDEDTIPLITLDLVVVQNFVNSIDIMLFILGIIVIIAGIIVYVIALMRNRKQEFYDKVDKNYAYNDNNGYYNNMNGNYNNDMGNGYYNNVNGNYNNDTGNGYNNNMNNNYNNNTGNSYNNNVNGNYNNNIDNGYYNNDHNGYNN